MKKILSAFFLFLFIFSYSANSVEKNQKIHNYKKKQSKDEKFFKKCSDDCMSKKIRCIKEGNKGKYDKNRMYTRGYCDNNYRNCFNDCQTRYGKKK